MNSTGPAAIPSAPFRGAVPPVLPALLWVLASCAGNGASPGPDPDASGPVAVTSPPSAEPAARAETGPEAGPLSSGDARDPAFGEALQEAWYQHPRMRAARARLLAGHGFEIQADLWPNPELSVGAAREPGEKLAYPVTLAQTFELGGKRGARVSAAAARTFLAETECREAWVAVRADVKAALVRRAYAQEILRLREAVRDLDAEAQGLARSLVDAGKAAASLWETAREQAARSAAGATAARALLEDTGRQVDAALGRPLAAGAPAAPGASEGAALDVTGPAAGGFDRLLALAETHNPLLATAAARVALADAEEQLALTRRWSDATLFVGVTPIDRDEGRSRVGWGAGLSVGLPVWDRGQGDAQARAELARAAREDRADAVRLVAARLSGVVADAAQWEADARSYRETVLPAAARRAELAADAARQGKSARREALDAARALRERELEAARARLMRSAAVIELERVAGAVTGVEE